MILGCGGGRKNDRSYDTIAMNLVISSAAWLLSTIRCMTETKFPSINYATFLQKNANAKIKRLRSMDFRGK
jgi:hypothetical protein